MRSLPRLTNICGSVVAAALSATLSSAGDGAERRLLEHPRYAQSRWFRDEVKPGESMDEALQRIRRAYNEHKCEKATELAAHLMSIQILQRRNRHAMSPK